jgi:VanZ family protein
MKIVTFWRVVFAVIFIGVTWLTLTPNPHDTKSSLAIARFIAEVLFHDQQFGDKVAHFLAYAMLGGAAAFAGFRIADRRVPVIVALAAYGALLEFLQGIGGVRVADLADAAANASGALVVYPAALAIEQTLARLRAA